MIIRFFTWLVQRLCRGLNHLYGIPCGWMGKAFLEHQAQLTMNDPGVVCPLCHVRVGYILSHLIEVHDAVMDISPMSTEVSWNCICGEKFLYFEDFSMHVQQDLECHIALARLVEGGN